MAERVFAFGNLSFFRPHESEDRRHVSLARASLLYDWRRYLAAVVAVAFSGLLIIVQIALLVGMFGTVTTLIDQSSASLWAVDPSTVTFDQAPVLPSRAEMQVRAAFPDAIVQPLLFLSADWRTPGGRKVAVTVFGVDVTDASLSFPNTVPPAIRVALRRPGAVAVDWADLEKLGVTGAPRVAPELNGHAVFVVQPPLQGFRTIGGATILASTETVRSLSNDSTTIAYLIKTPSHLSKDAVPRQGKGDQQGFTLYDPRTFSAMSQRYWLMESGAGAGFLFSAGLGLLVGATITSQTQRAATLSMIREYAALRALGVPLAGLRRIVLEQSLWIGLIGLGLSALLTTVALGMAGLVGVAMTVTWWAVLITVVGTLAIAAISGVASLRPLTQSDPSELLR